MCAEAAENPHRILIGTPTYSSHSRTALYETHIAGEEESGCVVGKNTDDKKMFLLRLI